MWQEENHTKGILSLEVAQLTALPTMKTFEYLSAYDPVSTGPCQ